MSFDVRTSIPSAVAVTISLSAKKLATVMRDSTPLSWKISSSAVTITAADVNSEKSKSSMLPFLTSPIPAISVPEVLNNTQSRSLVLITIVSGPCRTQPVSALTVPS